MLVELVETRPYRLSWPDRPGKPDDREAYPKGKQSPRVRGDIVPEGDCFDAKERSLVTTRLSTFIERISKP